MLAAPFIEQPLRPFAFPPPSASSPIAAPPTFAPTSHTAGGPSSAQTGHRHSRQVREALQLLQRLADEVDTPGQGGESDEDDDEGEQGIINNLESRGWVFAESRHGIRIFHSFSQDPKGPSLDTTTSPERARSVRTTAGRGVVSPSLFGPGGGGGNGSRGAGGPATRGLRADETMLVRGEGWIEGAWRREDVAATITSIGARAVWDPRVDASKSYIAEYLSETDSLAHLTIRGTLVADRDASIATTCAPDKRREKDNVLYVAATSVEDPLIPRNGNRTQISLSGFALRSLSRAPDFEPPPPLPTPLDGPLQPTRPSHRRTRSTMSAMQSASGHLGTIPLPPLPPPPGETNSQVPQRPSLLASATHVGTLSTAQQTAPPPLAHTLSSSTSISGSLSLQDTTSSSFAGTSSYPPLPYNPFSPTAPPPQKRGSLTKPSAGPGLAVSMIVRAAPGYNLPQTTVNQLSVSLPLSIAAVDRFLSTHGFAPHLVRQRRVKIREEHYDPGAGRYRVVFAVRNDSDVARGDEPIRVRFHGASFARGRFDLEIQHVEPAGWTLEYDHPPRGGSGQQERMRMDREDEEVGGEGSGIWRSRMSVAVKAIETSGSGADGKGRKGSATSLLSPVSADEPPRDGASLPGPAGGCTLVISPSATDPFLPVTITISRSTTDSAALPLSKMRGMSTALASASHVALDPLCNSVEELLEYGVEGSEARADVLLKGARVVLRELETAREREQAGQAMAAAAAAAATRWGGRRTSYPSGGPLSGASGYGRRASRDSEPGSFPFNSPFAIPTSPGSRFA
ncbi:hypothetical protein JCM8097_004287 [Rhodosporidiobolus ruineniae]